MSMRLFTDAELTNPVSVGDMSNPDADTFDGKIGEVRDRELFLANEQSALAANIDSAQTAISLQSAAFADGDLVIVGSEIMKIVSGGGTTALTVQRGVSGTAPAAHTSGSKVYLAVDYDAIVITPEDTSGSDESGWVTLALSQGALDGATPGEALAIGDKPHNETISFWRRYTVPAETPVQNKTDIKLKVTGTERPA